MPYLTFASSRVDKNLQMNSPTIWRKTSLFFLSFIMCSLNIQRAEIYLAWFKSHCQGEQVFVTWGNCYNRRVPRVYARCLKIARNLDSRSARMFLRKWHEDTERCEIIAKIGHDEIKLEEQTQAIEFLEDLTRFIRHVCSSSPGWMTNRRTSAASSLAGDSSVYSADDIGAGNYHS